MFNSKSKPRPLLDLVLLDLNQDEIQSSKFGLCMDQSVTYAD